MKIAISYPPLDSGLGVPLLAQNRQFQWFNSPTFIYPVVPATAATLLKNDGFDVLWDDSVAGQRTYDDWLDFITGQAPDVIAIETKTPVVKRHWKIIAQVKERAKSGKAPVIVLMGDHVTACPDESMENCPADYVLTGGDYDFLLLNLCRELRSAKLPENTSGLEPGIYYRRDGRVANTGRFSLDHDLKTLPAIDRDLTKWRAYSEKNGNFKKLPGTYTMAGRDCWWAKCTFCSWTTLYPDFRTRKAVSVLDEIGGLISGYGIREVMDDTGTFPTGEWLREFCRGMVERGYDRKIFMDCNMRFGAADKEDYKLMKKAGFRLLLFGLESANPATLERLRKGVTVEKIIESCALAREAGLYPHITLMFGYPWESYEDALKTIRLGKWLLQKGLAWTVQATIVIPYPGTPLFEQCREQGSLTTLDWDMFDMRAPVIKTPYPASDAMALVQKIYSTAFNPEFLVRRLIAVRDVDDLKYFSRAATKVMGHLLDFKAART